MLPLRLVRVLAAVPVCLLALACTEPEAPEVDDPDAVLAEAVEFEANYERLDANGVITDHDPDNPLNNTTARIWANASAAEVFRTLDPANPDPSVVFPRGAILVKESFDGMGNPTPNLQVMAKFEAGYNPLGKDWFFAMIDREGAPIDGKIGKGPEVTGCIDCHDADPEATDMIIGLPAEELAP